MELEGREVAIPFRFLSIWTIFLGEVINFGFGIFWFLETEGVLLCGIRVIIARGGSIVRGQQSECGSGGGEFGSNYNNMLSSTTPSTQSSLLGLSYEDRLMMSKLNGRTKVGVGNASSLNPKLFVLMAQKKEEEERNNRVFQLKQQEDLMELEKSKQLKEMKKAKNRNKRGGMGGEGGGSGGIGNERGNQRVLQDSVYVNELYEEGRQQREDKRRKIMTQQQNNDGDDDDDDDVVNKNQKEQKKEKKGRRGGVDLKEAVERVRGLTKHQREEYIRLKILRKQFEEEMMRNKERREEKKKERKKDSPAAAAEVV